MTIIIRNSQTKPATSSGQLATKRVEAERMHDVQLLLQNLTNNEEATVKLILDCLYDIGAVNLINQKFRYRPLNRTMKLIARMSKPVFRIFAWHWFKNNCPQLITTWLYTKVSFENPTAIPTEIASEALEIEKYSPSQVESLSRENRYLRHQVKVLAGFSILALSTLGLVVATINPTPEAQLNTKQQIQSLTRGLGNRR